LGGGGWGSWFLQSLINPVFSEFEELEAAPALVEGPLEPQTSSIMSTTTHVQEDPLSAFFSVWKLFSLILHCILVVLTT
jgi:hypothetical protein